MATPVKTFDTRLKPCYVARPVRFPVLQWYNSNREEVFAMEFKVGYCRPGEEHWRSARYYQGQGSSCVYPGGYFFGTECTHYWYDAKDGRYNIEINMPGFDKKDISLDMWGENFCVWAKRDGKEYTGCYTFPHDVDVQKADAWYESDVLRIHAPVKDWDKRTHVGIH